MKVILLLFICLSVQGMDYEQWSQQVAEKSPLTLLDFLQSTPEGGQFQKALEDSRISAGPFKSPVLDISNVSGDKVKNGAEEKSFAEKISGSGYHVIRYTFNSKQATKALIKIQRRGLFKSYLNGDALDESSSSVLIKKKGTDHYVDIKSGINTLIFLGRKTSRSPGVQVQFVDEKGKNEFLKKIKSLETVNKDNQRSLYHLLYYINRDKNAELMAFGIKRLMKSHEIDKKNHDLMNVLREGLTPTVINRIHKDVEIKKMAHALQLIDSWNIRNRLHKLALDGQGDYINKVFEILETSDLKKGVEYSNNVFSMGELLLACGDYPNAHKMFKRFDESTVKKESHRVKNIKTLLIESSNFERSNLDS